MDNNITTVGISSSGTNPAVAGPSMGIISIGGRKSVRRSSDPVVGGSFLGPQEMSVQHLDTKENGAVRTVRSTLRLDFPQTMADGSTIKQFASLTVGRCPSLEGAADINSDAVVTSTDTLKALLGTLTSAVVDSGGNRTITLNAFVAEFLAEQV